MTGCVINEQMVAWNETTPKLAKGESDHFTSQRMVYATVETDSNQTALNALKYVEMVSI